MSTSELLNAWGASWAAFMWAGLVEGTILLLVVALLWRALRRRGSAQLGYCLFLLVPIKLLIPMPVTVPATLARFSPRHVVETVARWTTPGPQERGSSLVGSSDMTPVPGPQPGLPEGARDEAPRIASPSQRPLADQPPAELTVAAGEGEIEPAHLPEIPSSPARPGLSPAALLLLGWLAVVAGLLARFAWVQWRIHRLIALATPLNAADLPVDLKRLQRLAGLGTPVRLVQSPVFSSPAVWGLWQPRIVLPVGLAEDLTPNQMTWVLLHELAHIRRRDLLVALVQRLVQIVYFFHPAVWLANRLIDEQREYACDDAALAVCQLPRRDCGEGFLFVVERASTAGAPVPAMGLFNSRTFIRRRLMRILDRNRPVARRLSAGAALLLFGTALLFLPRLQADDQKLASSAAAGEQGAPPAAAPKADPADAVLFSGRVLDPDGKPFAGAKLYVTIKSAMHMPLKLKDPQTKIFEMTDVDGKPAARIIHPKLIEVMKRQGLDPSQPITEDKVQGPKLKAEFSAVMAELYEEHPFQFPPVRAQSGPDGRFRFAVSQSLMKAPYHEDVDVLAVAEGYGPGWCWSSKEDAFTDITVRLVKDVPINGRIIDLEGRPVAGAKVKMGSVMVGPDGTIKAWEEMIEASLQDNTPRFNELMRVIFQHQLLQHGLNLLPESVTTDKDGRFQIRGVGAERIVFNMEVSGPGIGSESFSVITRTGPGLKTTGGSQPIRPEYRTYGATFGHVMMPARIVAGTIRDKATGKPLAGVQVAAWGPQYTDAFTDKDGKYKLVGLVSTRELDISVWPWSPRGQPLPYLNTSKRVRNKSGLERLTVDFDLVRGVELRGRLIDKATGKAPAQRAEVVYATFKDNPHAAAFAFDGNPAFRDNPDLLNVPLLLQTHTTCGPDGAFSLIVLPGRGVVGVRLTDSPYAIAELPEADREQDFWSKTVPHIGQTTEFQALKLIDLDARAEKATCDLTLNPGRAVKGTIVGPEGKPVVGARVTGLTTSNFESTAPLKSADFTVTGLTAKHPRLVSFYHPELKLGAQRQFKAGDDEPLTIHLEKCATVSGRLLDADKTRRAGIRVVARADDQPNDFPGRELSTTTDKDGCFQIEGLFPNTSYHLFTHEGPANQLGRLVARDVKVGAGATRELGDVVTKPAE